MLISEEMDLRTKVNIEVSPFKISYNNGVMFIGSCFASSIGEQMELGRMPVIINPAGAVFNPVSVCKTIDNIISGKVFVKDDLYFYNNTWLSFSHYTDFSSEDPLIVLEKINKKAVESIAFLSKASFLFITLGTARVYKLKQTGKIVSNCHKLPSEYFERELLTVDYIAKLFSDLIDRLHSLFPRLKVVFTISPVRHLKDGAHGNQVSKSVLFLAVEELLNHRLSPGYFPAYELLMDDLRDYRFYDDDMLHPSDLAKKYIWEAFSVCYLEKETLNIYSSVTKITKACKHRIQTESESKKREFAERMQKQISEIEAKVSTIDFSGEKKYFQNLISF